MLSIVIADDEPDIVRLVRMLIEYPDAEVIGEASNSQELFERIGELHPNTVITDICMPGMTGLELIEKARKVYPDVNFIVMSGFAEFEYAQAAVRLGVIDYLLKPVSQADLNRILKKLDERLKEEDERSSSEAETGRRLEKSVDILRQRYILDSYKAGKGLAQPSVGEKPIFDFTGKRIQAIFYSVDGRFSAKTPDADMLVSKAEKAFAEIGQMLCDTGVQHAFAKDGTAGINLIVYPEDSARELSAQIAEGIGGILRSYNHQNGFAMVAAAASGLLEGGESAISEAFRQAAFAISCRLERTDSRVIAYSVSDETALERVPKFDNENTKIQNAMDARDSRLLRQSLFDVFDGIKQYGKTPGVKYRLCSEVSGYINGCLEALPGFAEVDESMLLQMFEILSGASTNGELARRIADLTLEALKKYDTYFAKKENNVILQAKQYIGMHYAEDISLDSVARHVCLNASYFSTLFKNETGLGFAKYLQSVRAQAAKKLLKTTKMRIEDIAAAVGYRDVKSFNKVFVNETKVKPSEYRKFYA